MFTARSVTSVAPALPACATPLPSDGSSVTWPAIPALSTVRSPYVEDGPLRNTVPAPPLGDGVPPRTTRFDSTVPAEDVYSIAMAPPPPRASPELVTSPARASTTPAPASDPAVIQTDPPAPVRRLPPTAPPFARMTLVASVNTTAPAAMRTMPPPALPDPPPFH